MTNDRFTQIGIQGSTFGDNADISISQTIHVPQPDRPIPSNVRAGSRNFVEYKGVKKGNETSFLAQLAAGLENNQGVIVCAVEGMGGVGKTELALQYAQQHKDKYTAQYWLPLRDKGLAAAVVDFASGYITLPKPQQKLPLADQAAWYWQNWLPEQGNLLVILDDVPNPESLPERAMPVQERVKVIITTRERGLDTRFIAVSVEEMPLEKAVALLEKIVGTAKVAKERDTVEAICETLGRLPLAVELVGEYLAKKRHLSFAKVQAKLALADQVLSQDRNRREYGHRGVAAALKLTWDDLTEASRKVALFLSLFDRAGIHWALVEQIATATDLTEIDLEEARGALDRLHLIRPLDEDCTAYTLHALVQEFCQDQLRQQPHFNTAYRRAFVDGLLAIAKQIPQDPTLDLIQAVEPAIPHLERLSQSFLDDIANPEEDLLWVFVGVGWFYQGQGQYALAEVPLQNCVQAVQKLLGDRHPNVAISFNDLAGLYQLQGRYAEAKSLFCQALQLMQEIFGDRHPAVATSFNNLAGLYESQGRYEEAEPLYQKALQLRQELLGDRHPDVATSFNNLAGLYESQGRYEEAEPLYRQALQLRQELLGERHPAVATSFNNLAGLYESQGRYEEAEPLYQKALQLRQERLGERHPSVATSFKNLALLYRAQGRYEEAEPLYQKALQLRQELLGERHPDVATSFNNLAALYKSQGRYEEAEPLYRQALQLRQELLGDRHPDVATSFNNLAALYDSQGRYAEAEPLLQKALQLRQELLGVRHPDVAISFNNLAALYDSQGRYEEAEPLYRQSLEICETTLGTTHPTTIAVRNNLQSMRGSSSPSLRPWQWVIAIVLLPIWFLITLLVWLGQRIQQWIRGRK